MNDFEATIQNLAYFRERAKYFRERVLETEDLLRVLAMDQYDPEKPETTRPHPALTIKTFDEVQVDTDVALPYAIGQGQWIKVQLDETAYKKAAKVLAEGTLPGITRRTIQKTTIKRDLSEYMPEPL